MITISIPIASALFADNSAEISTAIEAPSSVNKNTAAAFETKIVDSKVCGDLKSRSNNFPAGCSFELVSE